jgi:hypothetical protein
MYYLQNLVANSFVLRDGVYAEIVICASSLRMVPV